MNAVATELLLKAAGLSSEARRPLPGSRRIYVEGGHGIRVPMREIALSPTRTQSGLEPNPPVTVYDTSGPYTDPEAKIDLLAGLAPLRAAWIEARGDSGVLSSPSSEFGRRRADDPKTAHLRFPNPRPPRRARAGANVSQMHYARRGIITPEMEFVAIRENARL